MQRTDIPYLDYSWNPIKMRCTPIAAGCKNCWHLGYVNRHKNNPTLSQEVRDAYAGGEPVLVEKELAAPLRKREPARIGVMFMGDLFHEKVPFEYIDMVMAVIASSGEQTFLILTKRPKRMAEWFKRVEEKGPVHANMYQSALIDYYSRHGVDLTLPHQVPAKHTPELEFIYNSIAGVKPTDRIEDRHSIIINGKRLGQCVWRKWPLSNLGLGTSVSTQPDADKNIPILMQIPAAFRVVSFEPALERVDFGFFGQLPKSIEPNYLAGQVWQKLHWLIVGCESGPKARLCDIEVIRDAVRQAKEADVPAVFVKQVLLPGCRKCRFDPCTHLHGHKQINIVSKNPDEWPEDLRVQEYPDFKQGSECSTTKTNY